MNAQLELRGTSSAPVLAGYAAVFNSPYSVSDGFTERISRGAFRRTLASRPDVVLTAGVNGPVLARTTSGTLTLGEDSRGLKFVARLESRDPDVVRLVPKVKRGDLTEMSFGFRTVEDKWSDDKRQRTLQEVSLNRGEVSLVARGANPAATATLRRATFAQRARAAAGVGDRCGDLSLRAGSVRRARRDPGRDVLELVKARRARLRKPAMEKCTACGGTGSIKGEGSCPKCAGRGVVPVKRGPIGVPAPGGPTGRGFYRWRHANMTTTFAAGFASFYRRGRARRAARLTG